MDSLGQNQESRHLRLVKARAAAQPERCSAASVNIAALFMLYKLSYLTKSDQKRVMKRVLRLLGESTIREEGTRAGRT